MKASRSAAGLVMAVIFSLGSAQAQNSVVVSRVNLTATGEPVCFGDDARYKATLSGPHYLSGIKWYYKWKGCSPDLPEERWLSVGGTPLSTLTVDEREELLGEFDIRAEVTFNNGMGGTYTVNDTKTYSVLPPDTVSLATPGAINTPVEAYSAFEGPNLQLAFHIKKGSRILANCGGTALESLNRTKYGFAPNKPMSTGDPGYLTATAGAILDTKGVKEDAAFASVSNGVTMDEFDQTFGIRLPKGCGGTEDITLAPAFHFQMIKVDFFHWKLMNP